MFNIKEVFEMTKKMGIKINDGSDGNHYIVNEKGKRVVFTTEMLIRKDERKASYSMKINLTKKSNGGRFNANYKIANLQDSLVNKTVDVNKSIIDAA